MEYALLLYGDEKRWANATPDERTAEYGRHTEFMRVTAEAGHKMTGGAELRLTPSAKTLRASGDDLTITDGPYTETTEQLGGFYIFETDDIDGLMQLAAMLSQGQPIEVRPIVPSDEQG